MGSLTANLHALLTSFYKPTASRHKIMFEGKAFPSDQVSETSRSKGASINCQLTMLYPRSQYAFASQVALREFAPSSLLRVNPREGEYVIRTQDILDIIEREGDSIAIICFGAVQYYSAEYFDMEAITKAGHAKVGVRA
jgi:kynureninase